MDDAFMLSDVFGPRFLSSPSVFQAADWTKKRLEEIGLSSARLEGIGPVEEPGFRWSQRGWTYSRFSLNLLEPQYANLTAIPVPYSPSTSGVVQGTPIRLDLPPPVTEALSEFFARNRGKLRGKLLLISAARPIPLVPKPQLSRLSDEQPKELAMPQASDPNPPASPKPARTQPSLAEVRSNFNRLFRFLKDEGVVGLINGAPGESGNLFVSSPLGVPDPDPVPPPMIDLIPEQYNRLVRLVERGLPVKLDLELKAEFLDPREPVNVLAELPGGSLKNEIVMVGAHLDSWHGGTGATDNAAGVAIVLDALRVLKSLGVTLDRTVRVAFWGMHEMGTRGSRGYVQAHANEIPQIAYYLNADQGGGRVRGVFVPHENMRDAAAAWLVPVRSLGATTVSTRMAMKSDHRNFHSAGVKVLNLMQDPLQYETRTHHSTMDYYDYLSPEDMRQAVAVVATLLYQAASASQLQDTH
ncbi:MAG: M20/M25/M40 family metallo-hydrolase [Bryobacterales bacterium]|nr:M20/M25/M40 family metallo-hydrolase [Bryobacterales bacterium]